MTLVSEEVKMWRSCGCARYWGWIYVRRATLLDKFGRNFLILTGWRPNSSADSLPTGASGAPPPPPPTRDRRLRILAQTAYRSTHGWPGAPLLPHDQPNTRSIIISGQFSSFFSGNFAALLRKHCPQSPLCDIVGADSEAESVNLILCLISCANCKC